jgi:hypothetical protein
MESRGQLPLLVRTALVAVAASAALVAPMGRAIAPPAAAGMRITRDEALRQIFGARASFRVRTAYLTDAQVAHLRQDARAPVESKRVSWYEASAGDTLLGVAFIEQNVVRTMSETVLTALDASGRVKAVEILIWNEPGDYLPRRRWLDAARGLSEPARARPGESLPALAGATLSARAVSASIRRALACHRLLVAGGGATR